MGKHRDKIDIVAKILTSASKNVGKTQIMYEANLNYDMLKKYLAETIGYQLIHFDDVQRYQITEKGREFLEAYEKYSKANKHREQQMRVILTKKKELEKLFSDHLTFFPSADP
jgi:predicted transcriptional regulator